MKRVIIVTVLAVFMAAMGCVHLPKRFEVHVSVDVRQEIQQRASASLDFIEGKTDALPAPKKTSWLEPVRTFLAPTAHAAGSDAKTGILVSLRNRNAQIVDLKGRRLTGETNRGYLEFRDDPSIDAKQRNGMQQVIAAENKDRKLLYEEDARIEKDRNATVSMIERGYAMERLKRAEAGEWAQLPPKGEDFDAFKASAAGQRLGAGCVPEARVILK
jgi:hypothetical protein